MARAVQEIWPETKVTIGPVIENGWFYDFDREDPFSTDDLMAIERKMREIIALRDPVRTEVWDRARARGFYEQSGEPFKIELIEAIPEGEDIRMYWHGHWQDLCRGSAPGPYRTDSRRCISVDFGCRCVLARRRPEPDAATDLRGRIQKTGKTCRPTSRMIEEAEKRDHRKLGKSMALFHFQEEAPGMVFWHPNGWTVYRALEDYMRRRLDAAGYLEGPDAPGCRPQAVGGVGVTGTSIARTCSSPRSTRSMPREKRVNALKPMNCPCHVQIYNRGTKSYRDLPLRLAEFGSCHRYESSGIHAWPHARARVRPGRRPHLLHRRPDRVRNRPVHRVARADLPGSGIPEVRREAVYPPGGPRGF